MVIHTTSVGPRDFTEAGEQTGSDVFEVLAESTTFGLRLMDTPAGRNQASMLINKMYSWRGYAGTHALQEDPNRITLSASSRGDVLGTLTLGVDSPAGILADEIFKEEIDVFRARGAKVCEITKLAFDPSANSKAAMASLFHLAVLHARDIHGCTDLFIEVNPRHRRFYQNMLGFVPHGEPKNNPRVNAPAYLLRVGFDYVTQQIETLGGKGGDADEKRSFYPLFFSPLEEDGILQRLRERR